MASLPDPEACSRPWVASYPPGVPPTYQLPPVALPRLLDDAARDFPEHIALEYGQHTLTYAQMQEQVTELSAGLQTLPGDDPGAPLHGSRVLVRTGDGFSGPIVLFALWRVGAVPVPLGRDVPADTVADVVRRTGVTGAIGAPWILRRFPLPPLRFSIEVLDDEWHGRRLPRTIRELPSRLDPRTWRRRTGQAAPAAEPPVDSVPERSVDSVADRSVDSVADRSVETSDRNDRGEPLRTNVAQLLEAGAAAPDRPLPTVTSDALALVVVQAADIAVSTRANDARDHQHDGDEADDDPNHALAVAPGNEADPEKPTAQAEPTAPAGWSNEVNHTHRTVLATAFQTRLWIPDVQAGRERVLVTEPLHDPVGSAIGLMASVLSGATTILVDEDERALGKVIEQSAPTLLIARSRRMERLVQQGDSSEGDLTSLRVCLFVGDGLDHAKARQLERLAAGARVRRLNGWGPVAPITHGQPVYGRVHPRSYGLPVTSTVATIVDLDDPTVEQAVGEFGRLLVDGPQVPGDGWVTTDLIASVDADGWFTVVGHDHEVTTVGGRPRSPTRIVGELLTYPTVREAHVLEVDGELVAAVAPVRRKRLDPAKLRGALALHLDSRVVPDDIVVLDFLPRDLLAAREAAVVEAGREELREQIRAAREAASMHTVPEGVDAPDAPDAPRPNS